MSKYLLYVFSILKTIYINFKVLKFKEAIRMPIAISRKVKLRGVYKDCIIINGEIKPFMIHIGFGGSDAIIEKKGQIIFTKNKSGRIIFNGKCYLGAGINICINKGTITFGNNFSCNKNCFYSCSNKITFEDNVLVGWDCKFRDSDGHQIFPITKKESQIYIENHVWICSYSDLLKGSKIGSNSVVAYKSLVLKEFEKNSLLGGIPAVYIKKIDGWKE